MGRDQPVCVITFEKGHHTSVVGDLDRIREQLAPGGMVKFDDPYTDAQVVINSALVTKVESQPAREGEGEG